MSTGPTSTTAFGAAPPHDEAGDEAIEVVISDFLDSEGRADTGEPLQAANDAGLTTPTTTASPVLPPDIEAALDDLQSPEPPEPKGPLALSLVESSAGSDAQGPFSAGETPAVEVAADVTPGPIQLEEVAVVLESPQKTALADDAPLAELVAAARVETPAPATGDGTAEPNATDLEFLAKLALPSRPIEEKIEAPQVATATPAPAAEPAAPAAKKSASRSLAALRAALGTIGTAKPAVPDPLAAVAPVEPLAPAPVEDVVNAAPALNDAVPVPIAVTADDATVITSSRTVSLPPPNASGGLSASQISAPIRNTPAPAAPATSDDKTVITMSPFFEPPAEAARPEATTFQASRPTPTPAMSAVPPRAMYGLAAEAAKAQGRKGRTESRRTLEVVREVASRRVQLSMGQLGAAVVAAVLGGALVVRAFVGGPAPAVEKPAPVAATPAPTVQVTPAAAPAALPVATTTAGPAPATAVPDVAKVATPVVKAAPVAKPGPAAHKPPAKAPVRAVAKAAPAKPAPVAAKPAVAAAKRPASKEWVDPFDAKK